MLVASLHFLACNVTLGAMPLFDLNVSANAFYATRGEAELARSKVSTYVVSEHFIILSSVEEETTRYLSPIPIIMDSVEAISGIGCTGAECGLISDSGARPLDFPPKTQFVAAAPAHTPSNTGMI